VKSVVKNSGSPLRLAMLGMIPGNGHPFSRSSIISGYDPAAFVEFLQTGKSAYPFADTVELMAIIIADLRSRAENSRCVDVAEIINPLST